MGSGRRQAPGGGHRRPGHPAGEGHLVPGHQLAPARWPREADSPHPAAGLAEIVRIYGIRHWIEQSYKQVKDELGWADFQVRSDVAIRRHQVLVNCAFSFCWDAWFDENPAQHSPRLCGRDPAAERGGSRRQATPAGTVLAGGDCARCAPGWHPGSCCSAGGEHGRRRPRRGSCKP